MNRAVIGLDPSSAKIAMTIAIDGAKPYMLSRNFVKGGDIGLICLAMFRYTRSKLLPLVNDNDEVHMFIEEPVYVRGHAAVIRQARANGAILAGARSAGARTHLVQNTSWKKKVIGNGNANKAAVSRWVRDNWSYAYVLSSKDQDLIDSACILRYGQLTLDIADNLNSN